VTDIGDILANTDWWVYLIHLLLYPVYQIIGTAKHEYAHAIAAKAQGLKIIKVSVLPSRIDGQWYWGYTQWSGGVANTLTLMAPYIVDAIFFLTGILLITNIELEWWANHIQTLFITLILLFVLPLVDLWYNVLKWWIRDKGDFAETFGSGD
jgi:hypothetical protein